MSGDRPTVYCPDLAERILERVADGEFLAAVCRDEGMPKLWTVYGWKAAIPEFAQNLASARDAGAENIVVDLVKIGDTTEQGEEITEFSDGTSQVKKADMLGHRRLRVYAREKALTVWHNPGRPRKDEGDGEGRVPVYNSPSAEMGDVGSGDEG